MLEPSGWFTSTWCSIIGLVGVVIRGCVGVYGSTIGGVIAKHWYILFVHLAPGLDQVPQVSQVNGLNMSTQLV